MAVIFLLFLKRVRQLSPGRRPCYFIQWRVKRSAARADESAHFLGQIPGAARNALHCMK